MSPSDHSGTAPERRPGEYVSRDVVYRSTRLRVQKSLVRARERSDVFEFAHFLEELTVRTREKILRDVESRTTFHYHDPR